MKICSACKQEKPISDFGPNRFHSDGLQSYCRPCGREATRRTRQKRGPEPDRAQSRAYGRALRALATQHRHEFEQLYAEAMIEEHIRR